MSNSAPKRGLDLPLRTEDQNPTRFASFVDDGGAVIGQARNANIIGQKTVNTYYNNDGRTGMSSSTQKCKPFDNVPFAPDPDFVDRPEILAWIRDKCSGQGARAALFGLGGVGKSQLAIQYAHGVRDATPNVFVFWVHASTKARFEEAYTDLAERLALPGRDDPNANVLQLVSTWLCDEMNGQWIMIVDNADDAETFFPPQIPTQDKPTEGTSAPLAKYLPQSLNGSILFTSRNKDAAARLAGGHNRIKEVSVMDESEGLQLLRNKLDPDKLQDTSNEKHAMDLLRALDCLPLTITQAAAYINQGAHMTILRYLTDFHSNNKKRETLLHWDAGDLRRDESASNSVVTTWQISFERIRQERPSAADLLSLMSFFSPQSIPQWILQKYCEAVAARTLQESHRAAAAQTPSKFRRAPAAWTLQKVRRAAAPWTHQKSRGAAAGPGYEDEADDMFDEDLTILEAYSFLAATAEPDMYEMHPLVKLCTQVWLSSSGGAERWKLEYVALMAALGTDHPDTQAGQDDASSDSAGSESTVRSMLTRTSLTLVEKGFDPELVAQMVATRLVQDPQLSGMYRKALQAFGNTGFRRSHDLLLIRFFSDLGHECEENAPRKATIRCLRRSSQRSLLTTEITATISPENLGTRKAWEDLKNSRRDDMDRINSMLREGTREHRRPTIPVTADRTKNMPRERKQAISHGVGFEEIGSDADASGDDSDKEEEQDPDGLGDEEEEQEPVDLMLEYLVSGNPFKRYLSRFHQLLFPPTTLASALNHDNVKVAKDLIVRNFEDVRMSFSYLADLERSGHTPRDIASILFDKKTGNCISHFEPLDQKPLPVHQLRILPYWLRRVACSIPKHRIWFTSTEDQDDASLSNRLKAFVEDYTGASWLWWPLLPRMKRIGPDQKRLNWICSCGKHAWAEISVQEAEVLDSLIEKRVHTPSQSVFCRERKARPSLLASIWGTIRLPGQQMLHPTQPGVGAYELGARSRGRSSSASPQQNQKPAAIPVPTREDIPESTSSRGTRIQDPQTPETKDLRVLLRTPNSSRRVDFATIEVDMQEPQCDSKFYQNLKQEYRKSRGTLRIWLSCWQLAYCDFVCLRKTRSNKLAHHKRSIPMTSDYEYSPRPPELHEEEPPISAHEFEVYFRTCDGNCTMPIFHVCLTAEDGDSDVKRIPKKIGPFDTRSPGKEFFWGLEVVYGPSFLHVIIYHLLMFAIPFTFWGCWRWFFSDEASASVPASAVLSIFSCFWTSVGAMGYFKRPERGK